MELTVPLERGNFLSLFLFGSYNWYWLAALAVSISITSLLAVVIPNVWVRRHHNGIRLFNEFLARHQLGLCTYYGAILVSTNFSPEQGILRMAIIGLLLLSFPLSLYAAKWASPGQQELLLQGDHACPANPPSAPADECKNKVKCSTMWELCRNNLCLLGSSLVVAGLLLPFFLKQEAAPQPAATTALPSQPARQVATEIPIASCRTVVGAPGRALNFLRHSIAILRQDTAGREYSRVCFAESAGLGTYYGFVWKVELWPEFSSYLLDFGDVYLRRDIDRRVFYNPLPWKREGQSYRVEIPDSMKEDRIFIVLALSGNREVPEDCKGLLKATVGTTGK